MVESAKGELRFRAIDRNRKIQGTLDELVPQDDEVRIVEAFVAQLDCSGLEAPLKVYEGTSGAPAFKPQLLLALSLYALIRGIYSFRQLSRACRRDLPLMWLCGGCTPSYRTLSGFYSSHEAFLEKQFTEMLVTLREQGLVNYSEVTLDGRKIPANANKESLHRVQTLTEHYAEASERVKRLRAERDEKSGQASRQEAARLRGAQERCERLKAALETLETRTKERVESKSGKPEETRTSETDPDSRKMKMSDGGYRPAFNVQTVTETQAGLIVAIEVVDQASDNGFAAPMVAQAEEVTGTKVERVLLDAGYSSSEDVEKLEKDGTKVYMPPKNERKEKAQGKDPYQRKRRDSARVARWRQRMGEEESKATCLPAGRSTAVEPRWPKEPTRGKVTAASNAFGCVVYPRLGSRCCGKRWSTTSSY